MSPPASPQFVQFESVDGLTQPGLLWETKHSKKAVIHLHGNGTNCIFYKTNHALVEVLGEAGYSSLQFNNRGAHLVHSHKVQEDEELVRIPSGMAHEIIADSVLDIDAAVVYLESLGYEELVLLGSSTGANKICVYDHYKKDNPFASYILLGGGDDTGVYYDMLGASRFHKSLELARQMIKEGDGAQILKSLIDDGMIFSANGFYDIANPDGDYNCFPFLEKRKGIHLSKKQKLFDYFSRIAKPSLVVYGELDEYCGQGGGAAAIATLREYQPNFSYKVIAGADHGFSGYEMALSNLVKNYLMQR